MQIQQLKAQQPEESERLQALVGGLAGNVAGIAGLALRAKCDGHFENDVDQKSEVES